MNFNEWKNKKPINITINGNSYQINHADNVFIKDGIVCKTQWNSQKIRPLFLLKEAYHKENVPFWHLIDDHLLLKDNTTSTLWKRVSEWAYAIMNTTEYSIAEYDPKLWYEKLNFNYYGNEYLNKIAVMNIKKSNGKEISDMNEIQAYAEYDKKELKQQIEEINPTIIICGYTFQYLELILGKNIKKENYNENWFYFHTLDNGQEVLIIDYYHPANQYPKLLNYYGIANIYQQSLIARKSK